MQQSRRPFDRRPCAEPERVAPQAKRIRVAAFLRRIAKPIAPKPSVIIAQVAGSGTPLGADTNWKLSMPRKSVVTMRAEAMDLSKPPSPRKPSTAISNDPDEASRTDPSSKLLLSYASIIVSELTENRPVPKADTPVAKLTKIVVPEEYMV